MLAKSVMRQLFVLNQAPLRSTLFTTGARYGRLQNFPRYSSSLPSITQASFWESMIPKPFRRSNKLKVKKPKSTEWNPATFFIAILLLIGSMSIQMISLRNEFAAFMRRSDAKIGLLREVIEKVQNGEDVDVEGLLGAGDPEKEQEWANVLKEIENEEDFLANKKPGRRSSQSTEATEGGKENAIGSSANMPTKQKSNAPRGFY